MYITFDGLIAACIISFVMGVIVTFHALEIAFRTDGKDKPRGNKCVRHLSWNRFFQTVEVAPARHVPQPRLTVRSHRGT
jgi:hypothetical protein